jgi:hypothetical protein
MTGKSVAKLIFACFLSSCYSPPGTVVVLMPGGVSGSGGGGALQGGESGSGSGAGPSTTTVAGNCYYTVTTTSGGVSEKCRYSVKNPFNLCYTYVAECTSTPPSGKCSTTAPVAACF